MLNDTFRAVSSNSSSFNNIPHHCCPLTFSPIEDTDAPVPSIIYFIVPQHRVTVSLYPDSCHGIVKDLIMFDDTQSSIVHKDPPVLAAPDLVLSYQGIAPCADLNAWVEVVENVIVF